MHSSIARVLGEFEAVDLGDFRRTERLRQCVVAMAQQPSASLPAALATNARIEGAYRLFNSPMVSAEAIHVGHAVSTIRRAETCGDVLVIHDTTEAEFPDLDGDEIGYLQTNKPGFLIHLSLVLDAATWRRPLGVIHFETI